MTENISPENKNCSSKKRAMLAYGVIQLGTGVVSALSLGAIALGFCSVKQEAKIFTECVEEIRESGRSTANSVRFCNGG